MGHKRTIRPNAKKLSALFMARDRMDWDTFSRKVKSCQRGFMGEPEEMIPGRSDFHEYPLSCICRKPFNYSDVENDKNDQSSEEGHFALKSSYTPNKVYSRGTVSIVGDHKNDDFLAD